MITDAIFTGSFPLVRDMSLDFVKRRRPEPISAPSSSNPFASLQGGVPNTGEKINTQVDPVIASALKPVFEKLGGQTKLATIVGYAKAANLPAITYDSQYLDPTLCQEFMVAGRCSNPRCSFQHQSGAAVNAARRDEILAKLAPLFKFLLDTPINELRKCKQGNRT